MKLSMIVLSVSMLFLINFSIRCSQNLEYQVVNAQKYELKIPIYSQQSGREHAHTTLRVDHDAFDLIAKFMDDSQTSQTLYPVGIIESNGGKKSYRVDWITLEQKQEMQRLALEKEKELSQAIFLRNRSLFFGSCDK